MSRNNRPLAQCPDGFARKRVALLGFDRKTIEARRFKFDLKASGGVSAKDALVTIATSAKTERCCNDEQRPNSRDRSQRSAVGANNGAG